MNNEKLLNGESNCNNCNGQKHNQNIDHSFSNIKAMFFIYVSYFSLSKKQKKNYLEKQIVLYWTEK